MSKTTNVNFNDDSGCLPIIAILLLIIACNTCNAQVTIPDSVARFYLERHDLAKYLEKENEIIKQGLATLEKSLKGKDLVIKTFEEDAETYSQLILLEREKFSVCNSRIENLEKDLRKQRRKTKLITIGGAVLTTIALIL